MNISVHIFLPRSKEQITRGEGADYQGPVVHKGYGDYCVQKERRDNQEARDANYGGDDSLQELWKYRGLKTEAVANSSPYSSRAWEDIEDEPDGEEQTEASGLGEVY